MNTQNTRAACGTSMMIASVTLQTAFGAGLSVSGLGLLGLTFLLVSLIPAAPSSERMVNFGDYR